MKLLCAWITVCLGCGFGDNLPLSSGSQCGDSAVDAIEGCDDGNTISGDGCSDSCAVETTNPVCGNAVREVSEACDDGNTTVGDGCSPACGLESNCGNGTVEAGEQCDDRNNASGDGCSSTCRIEGAGACALVPQSGCSGSTPACDLASDGTTECRSVTTMGTSNSHCSASSACATGYTCVDNFDGQAVCSRFCEVDSDCLGTGSRCVIGLADDTGFPLNIDVCSNACDPYSQTGCPSGMGCTPVNTVAGDYTDCSYQRGIAFTGEACTTNGDCLSGDMCTSFSGQPKTCREICIVGNESSCTEGTCTGFGDPLTIGTVTYGACVL